MKTQQWYQSINGLRWGHKDAEKENQKKLKKGSQKMLKIRFEEVGFSSSPGRYGWSQMVSKMAKKN